MSFKKETLRNYIEKATSLYNQFKNDKFLPFICISNGNRKIGRVYNVSLSPILSCGNCSHCSGLCYDVKANVQYSNVLNARVRNYYLAKDHTKEYFAMIDEFLYKKFRTRPENKFFRWHVGGEIIDYNYFDQMTKIAIDHPDWHFWTYTKMHGIINCWLSNNGGKLPDNLIVMMSEWDGMPMFNPYDLPTFSCRLKGGNKNHDDSYFEKLWKCPGNCDICKKAHRGCIAGESAYADEH